MATCKCGKRMSKYANLCNKCHKAHMDDLFAQAKAIVSTGRCPECGQALVRNSALAGWWQCSGHGAEGFRVKGAAHCIFQIFTQ